MTTQATINLPTALSRQDKQAAQAQVRDFLLSEHISDMDLHKISCETLEWCADEVCGPLSALALDILRYRFRDYVSGQIKHNLAINAAIEAVASWLD